MFRGMDMNGKNTNVTREKVASNKIAGKEKFPIGWLLPVAVLSFFLAQVWSYAPVFRGIVSLFVFSKFLAGLWGTHFLL